VAAVFHIINHATFKASLFMAAGIIDHETGTRDMRRSTASTASCRTALLAMVASAAMAGCAAAQRLSFQGDVFRRDPSRRPIRCASIRDVFFNGALRWSAPGSVHAARGAEALDAATGRGSWSGLCLLVGIWCRRPPSCGSSTQPRRPLGVLGFVPDYHLVALAGLVNPRFQMSHGATLGGIACCYHLVGDVHCSTCTMRVGFYPRANVRGFQRFERAPAWSGLSCPPADRVPRRCPRTWPGCVATRDTCWRPWDGTWHGSPDPGDNPLDRGDARRPLDGPSLADPAAHGALIALVFGASGVVRRRGWSSLGALADGRWSAWSSALTFVHFSAPDLALTQAVRRDRHDLAAALGPEPACPAASTLRRIALA
jgi:hypothetical protein